MQHHNESVVYRRVEDAFRLYHAYGDSVLAISEMQRLLHQYDSAIENTQETMRRAGVAAACGLCAETTGSCCFEEVETWYDPMLLLLSWGEGMSFAGPLRLLSELFLPHTEDAT